MRIAPAAQTLLSDSLAVELEGYAATTILIDMARAPFQVLVLPYGRSGERVEYAVFQRTDLGVWQGLAGGGEDQETPTEAAQREAFEEAGIAPTSGFEPLASTAAISVEHFSDRRLWDPSLDVIPEYAFAVDLDQHPIRLSGAHTSVRWVDVAQALTLLEWESNRAALRELAARLTR
jgi:dATP pyrophosphohydrolase